MFLVFFGMAIALVMGAGAIAPEVEDETIIYLLSRPVGKTKYITAKYLVRGAEVMALIAVPLMCMVLPELGERADWMWVPPHLALQYLTAGLAMVAFTYTGAFFFSILFRRQALCALAGVTLLAAYLAARGMVVFRKLYDLEVIETDLLILFFLTLAAFGASALAFRLREF
jgi:ABC-type transport system involved in multi-copper enzyme maturation permease subunit